MNPVELLGLRMLIALPVMFLIMRAKGLKLDFRKPVRSSLIGGGAVLAFHFIIQIEGMDHTTATNTGWIIAVTPLVIAAMSFVFLRERIGVKGVIGIAVATAGILTLVSDGDFTDLDWLQSYGDWLILASAHTWAIYTVITRRITKLLPPLTVTFSVFLLPMLVSVTYMIFTSDWSRLVRLPAEPLIALLFLSLVATALGHWFWQEGVAELGATRAGVFLYFEPLAATALAVPMLDEHFGIFTAIGGLFVLGGVFLAQKEN
jgi:drug/metabolite transporter (DMT)-like permease